MGLLGFVGSPQQLRHLRPLSVHVGVGVTKRISQGVCQSPLHLLSPSTVCSFDITFFLKVLVHHNNFRLAVASISWNSSPFMCRSDLGLPSVVVELLARSLCQCLYTFAFEASQQFKLERRQYYLRFKSFMCTELNMDIVNAYAPARSYCSQSHLTYAPGVLVRYRLLGAGGFWFITTVSEGLQYSLEFKPFLCTGSI